MRIRRPMGSLIGRLKKMFPKKCIVKKKNWLTPLAGRHSEEKNWLTPLAGQILADNTFSFKRIRSEAPRDLRLRKVQVRYDRLNFDRAIVYYKGDRMGQARPVDFAANDRPRLKKG